MTHIHHSRRTSQALCNLISKHQLSLNSFETLSANINENELKEYCSSAVALRQTLIEDLLSEIKALDNAYEEHKNFITAPQVEDNPFSSQSKNALTAIKKIEKSIVCAYMEVIRSNTFPNFTESILNGHLETLRNRLRNIKNYNSNSVLTAA